MEEMIRKLKALGLAAIVWVGSPLAVGLRDRQCRVQRCVQGFESYGLAGRLRKYWIANVT